MPISLLLQAEDVDWTLPSAELLAGVPANVDRRGLFQLRPSCDYLSVRCEDAYFSVRRTSFLATPADTITVYAAQGGTYDAVVVDMQRPPSLDSSKHWLACYVMLSRARSLDGLLILRPATRKELSAKPPKYLLDELSRLAKEEASLDELRQYIDALPVEVPVQVRTLLQEDASAKELEVVAATRSSSCAPVSFPGPQTLRRRLVFKQASRAYDADCPVAGAADAAVEERATKQ